MFGELSNRKEAVEKDIQAAIAAAEDGRKAGDIDLVQGMALKIIKLCNEHAAVEMGLKPKHRDNFQNSARLPGNFGE